MDAAGERELDVRGPARSGDEVRDRADSIRVLAPIPELEEHAGLGQRLDQSRAIEDRDVAGGQQRGRARAPGAGAVHERSRLGDRQIDAGETDLGVGDAGTERGALGRVGEIAGRHREGLEPARRERVQEIGAELARVPGHEASHLALAGDAGHDLRDGGDRSRAVEHAGHALELELETGKRLRPPLGQLTRDRFADRARIGRTRRRPRGEQAGSFAHLGANAREELGTRCHWSGVRESGFDRGWPGSDTAWLRSPGSGVVVGEPGVAPDELPGAASLLSVAQRSWNVRCATAGRSRVRVQSLNARGTLGMRPSRANGRCSSRASGLLHR